MKPPHPIPAKTWNEIARVPAVVEAFELASVSQGKRGRALAERACGARFKVTSDSRAFDTYIVQERILDLRPVVLYRDMLGHIVVIDYRCAGCDKPYVRPRCPTCAEEGHCDDCRPGVSCEVCGYCSGMESNHRDAPLCLVCYRCSDCVPVPEPGATDCSCCLECATDACYRKACEV